VSRSDRIIVAAAGGSLVLALAAAWILVAPALEAGPAGRGDALFAGASARAVPSGPPGTGAATIPATIIVDIQGAVAEPGVRTLLAGARLGDAIAAAGGYGPDADLEVASRALNLAAPLADGAQVRVPRIGEAVAAVPSGGGGGGGTTGDGGVGGGGGAADLVDLNTATPEELEALPGIGEVTVQKIVAARQEAPFASLEDAVERGVLNRGQLEDIQGAATAG
jgi:competence protein ComEA